MADFIFSISPGETRFARRQGKTVTHLDFERTPSTLGATHRGRITSLRADLGYGFLTLEDGTSGLLNLKGMGFTPTEGQSLPVQVIREAFTQEDKGVRFSAKLEFPLGPLIFFPTLNPKDPPIKYSKALNPSRDLKEALDQMLSPGQGLVLRKSAQFFEEHQLIQGLRFLQSQAALNETHPPFPFLWRCLQPLTPQDCIRTPDATLVPSLKSFTDIFGLDIPIHVDPLAFDERVEDAWESLFEEKIFFGSQGNLYVEETRGLTVIDVNMEGSSHSLHHFQRQALEEAFRQIYLRDLSGNIVIDLIGRPHPETLSWAQAFSTSDTQILGLTRLNLLEMSRKRLRPSLPQRLMVEIKNEKSFETMTTEILRIIDNLYKTVRKGFIIWGPPLWLQAFQSDPAVKSWLQSHPVSLKVWGGPRLFR